MHHVIQRVGCSGVFIHLLLMVYHKNHSISLHPLYPTHFSSLSIPYNIARRRSNHIQASTSELAPSAASTIAVDNFDFGHYTAFVIRARNWIGLLQVITRVLKPTARYATAAGDSIGNCTIFADYPMTDLKMVVETADDLTQMQV